MTHNFDKYLDSKLRKSGIAKTSDNFTRLLMDKIQADYAIEAELRKRDRAANYIIGFFSSLIGIITIMTGYFYISTRAEEVSRFNNYIYSGSDAGLGFFERFTIFIQDLSLKITSILGFNQSSSFVNVIMLLIILSALYLLSDRIFMKHRTK
jgi:hypothetical protein